MIGSVRNKRHILRLAKLMKSGEAVAFYNRGVWALIGDGANQKFITKIAKIKGAARNNVPIATFSPANEISMHLDLDKIHPDLRRIFADHKKTSEWFGSICFLRLPIKKESAKIFPGNMVSWMDGDIPVIQNWDPIGHSPAIDIVTAMADAGIRFRAITSYNNHGEPEIIDRERAITFSQEKKIPMILDDFRDPRKTCGGYTIFSVANVEFRLIREGNIPSYFFRHHFFDRVITEGAKPPNHKVPPFPTDLFVPNDPAKSREKLLRYLNE